MANNYLEFRQTENLVKFAKDPEYDVRRLVYFGLRKKSKAEIMRCQFISVGCSSSIAEVSVSDFGLVAEMKDNLLLIPYNAITRIAMVRARDHKIAVYFETNDGRVGHGLIIMTMFNEFGYESFRDYEVDLLFKALQDKVGLDSAHYEALGRDELDRISELLGGVDLQVGTKVQVSLEEHC